MVIRKIQLENDLEDLYILLSQVWFLDDKNLFIENVKNIINDVEWFVVEQDNKIIGSTILYMQKKVIRNGCVAGLIEEVVVDEKYRGKKIGEKLIKHVTKKAEEKGCYKVILSCFPERIRFYERCGYKKESHTMRFNFNQKS